MSIAWIVLPALRFFLLCPGVIWCDVTSHSNNKGFHLLTCSCRTSLDTQVVFLYIWIPNEQRISFRWVFQHAIVNLVPKYACDCVRFIMKDGDPQQRNEIIAALATVLRGAKEGACGWHIIRQGWLSHVPGDGAISKFNRPRWKAVKKKIQNWCYSWVRPGYAGDKDEYCTRFLS